VDLWLSKLAGLIFSPLTLCLFLFLAGYVLLHDRWRFSQQWGRRLCFLGLALLIIFSYTPLGYVVLTRFENQFAARPLPPQVHGIIVLGGGEDPAISQKRGRLTVQFALDRLLGFKELSEKYPRAVLAYAGGSGRLNPYNNQKEADIAIRLLETMNMTTDQMIVEKTSRNTFENATHLAAMVRDEKSLNWVLVTSAWHMPRAMAAFRAAGWNVSPYATNYITSGDWRDGFSFDPTINLGRVHLAMRESLGLLIYYATGKTKELWPAR